MPGLGLLGGFPPMAVLINGGSFCGGRKLKFPAVGDVIAGAWR